MTFLPLLALALTCCSLGAARAEDATDVAPAPVAVDDESLTDAVPRGAVKHFVDACRAGDFASAAAFLDLSRTRAKDRTTTGRVLARRLGVVLERTAGIDVDSLSAEPGGMEGDGLPPDVDRVARIDRAHAGAVDVLLERKTLDDGRQAWQFAPSTVARIPALYDEFGYGPLGDVLPESFFVLRFLDIELWQWLGIVLLIVVAWPLSWAVAWAAGQVLTLEQAIGEVLNTTIERG